MPPAAIDVVADAVDDHNPVPGIIPGKQPFLSNIRKSLRRRKGDVESADEKPSTKEATDVKPLGYLQLYREAKSNEVLLLVAGAIGAFVAGLTLPAFTVVFGDLLNSFNPAAGTTTSISSSVNTVCLRFVYVAIVCGISSYFQVWAWMLVGLRITNRLRKKYLGAALRQDVAFYDTQATTGMLLQGLNEDANAIQNGIGEKVGTVLNNLGTFFGGLAVAFWKGWKLTLVMIAVLPALVIAGAVFGQIMAKLAATSQAAYAKANAIVQQALSNIRTVMSFNGQNKTESAYQVALVEPEKTQMKQGVVTGLSLGMIMAVMYCTYSLALWYGGTRVVAGDMNGGQVLNVLFAVLIGGFALGQAAPLLQHFIAAKSAGGRVDQIVQRVALIADEPGAQPPALVKGAIELCDVCFSYPARPDVAIFDGLDLTIPAGTTVALVGESGSGKSTVVSLVARFYDVKAGKVTLDGRDIRSLPLGWLRQQIGIVSQEPCLFQTSIYNNILYGHPEATQEQVYAAARAANAHDFIKNLPNGYDTTAGEAGAQVSGGQKQRIAIARAILKDPKILLLDEATSALDSTSERVVQKALETLMPGRTTIVVAHRLSTVKSFHIAVMKKGKVVETGSHSDLISRAGGSYATLVQLQQQRAAQEDAPDEAEPTEADLVLEEQGSRRDLSAKKISQHALEVEVHDKATWQQRCLFWKRLDEGKGRKQGGVSYWRLLRLNKPEAPYAVLGCLSSVMLGAQMPVFAIALGSIAAVYYLPKDQIGGEASKWAGVFAAIGAGTFLGSLGQQLAFIAMGAKLATRVRMLTFKALLRQELSWFDREDHSSGAVSVRLSTDAAAVRGAVGDQLGLLVQNLVTMIGGLVIAFVYGWRMTLVVLAVVPLMAAAGWFQGKFMTGFSSEADALFANANRTASEAFSNIRTVAAFQMEGVIAQLYAQLLAAPTKASQHRALVSGIGYGVSQGILFLVYALAFWYGGRQVDNGQMTFADVLKVFFAILLMALGISQSQMAFPDVSKAKGAIQNIFSIVDAPPASIDVDAAGTELASMDGTIELRCVTFAYPSRRLPVFRGFDLLVPSGSTAALVGPSGSGKSTVVALIQRFYDPQEGQVLVDGHDIRTLQLKWLRQHIGVVSQEPILFSASIKDNILYGNENATIDDVKAAARAANAGFIETLPEAYETQVGQSGIQLSGGQKQRVAIARALVKAPRILLLDEATSALDAESEAAVQIALNTASVGRTTLIVAHRLSTIRNADMIAVVQDGKILEKGTHASLIGIPGGSYAALVRHQQQR